MKVLLTGAGKGFGRSILEELFRNHDDEVFALTRSLDDFSHVEIESLRLNNIYLYQVDLSSKKELEKFLMSHDAILKKIDVLINNAGQRYRRSIEDMVWGDLEKLFSVNVYAPIILAQAVLGGMKGRRFGRIINISSILGTAGMRELSGYAATKGAIDSFTKSLAIELAECRITVNAIAPGFCKTSYYPNFKKNERLLNEVTRKIPLGRWGTASEINGLIDFLISERADYITGQVLCVDGGWTAQ